MSLLPPTSTFAEQVEVLFAVVRGRGLALGALDRQRIIARGLLRAAERARWNGVAGAAPRSLRACRPEVDAEIDAWKLRTIGARGAGQGDGV
jgi:hypothetical protein